MSALGTLAVVDTCGCTAGMPTRGQPERRRLPRERARGANAAPAATGVAAHHQTVESKFSISSSGLV